MKKEKKREAKEGEEEGKEEAICVSWTRDSAKLNK